MEDNDWEAISGSSTTTIHSDEDDVVLVPSVFPPSHHENLPVTPPPLNDHQPVSSSSSSSSLGVEETELPNEQETGGNDTEIEIPNDTEGGSSSNGVLRSGVLRVLYGIRGNVGVLKSEVLRVFYGKKVGVWSFAAVLSVLVVGVFGMRWRKWKRRVRNEANERMMLLINQKDEKIKQLLIQIDQLNEILSARRRVPVHRIVVDRPLVIKQRLNWKPT